MSFASSYPKLWLLHHLLCEFRGIGGAENWRSTGPYTCPPEPRDSNVQPDVESYPQGYPHMWITYTPVTTAVDRRRWSLWTTPHDGRANASFRGHCASSARDRHPGAHRMWKPDVHTCGGRLSRHHHRGRPPYLHARECVRRTHFLHGAAMGQSQTDTVVFVSYRRARARVRHEWTSTRHSVDVRRVRNGPNECDVRTSRRDEWPRIGPAGAKCIVPGNTE